VENVVFVPSSKSVNFKEELKMIDICALGPLRVTAALYNGGLLTPGKSKVVVITSQGGSITWRLVQNPEGGDYGHHMSKAAANMMSVLLSQELKDKDIPVGILHPGFNKSDMTPSMQRSGKSKVQWILQWGQCVCFMRSANLTCLEQESSITAKMALKFHGDRNKLLTPQLAMGKFKLGCFFEKRIIQKEEKS